MDIKKIFHGSVQKRITLEPGVTDLYAIHHTAESGLLQISLTCSRKYSPRSGIFPPRMIREGLTIQIRFPKARESSLAISSTMERATGSRKVAAFPRSEKVTCERELNDGISPNSEIRSFSLGSANRASRQPWFPQTHKGPSGSTE